MTVDSTTEINETAKISFSFHVNNFQIDSYLIG